VVTSDCLKIFHFKKNKKITIEREEEVISCNHEAWEFYMNNRIFKSKIVGSHMKIKTLVQRYWRVKFHWLKYIKWTKMNITKNN